MWRKKKGTWEDVHFTPGTRFGWPASEESYWEGSPSQQRERHSGFAVSTSWSVSSNQHQHQIYFSVTSHKFEIELWGSIFALINTFNQILAFWFQALKKKQICDFHFEQDICEEFGSQEEVSEIFDKSLANLVDPVFSQRPQAYRSLTHYFLNNRKLTEPN